MTDLFDRITAKAQGHGGAWLTPQAQPFFAPQLEVGLAEVFDPPVTLPAGAVPRADVVSPDVRAPQFPMQQIKTSAPKIAQVPMLEPLRDMPLWRISDTPVRGEAVHVTGGPREAVPKGRDVVRDVIRELRETTFENTRIETLRETGSHSASTKIIREQIERVAAAPRLMPAAKGGDMVPLVSQARQVPQTREAEPASNLRARVTIGHIRVTAPAPKPAPVPQPVVQMQPQMPLSVKGQALKSFLGWRR